MAPRRIALPLTVIVMVLLWRAWHTESGVEASDAKLYRHWTVGIERFATDVSSSKLKCPKREDGDLFVLSDGRIDVAGRRELSIDDAGSSSISEFFGELMRPWPVPEAPASGHRFAIACVVESGHRATLVLFADRSLLIAGTLIEVRGLSIIRVTVDREEVWIRVAVSPWNRPGLGRSEIFDEELTNGA